VCLNGLQRNANSTNQGEATEMTRDDAERFIIREFNVWVKTNGPSQDGMDFFCYLQRERSDLLKFGFSGDKWQAVHSMLLSNGKVSN
jgi:accessory colonization factor AcfC